MNGKKPEGEGYSRITPTAFGVTKLRAYSDIPYAEAVLKEIQGMPEVDDQIVYPPERAPQIEARYKLVDRMIAKSQVRQILELASGLTMRGLAMTQDSEVEYVELDLPEMVTTKESLLRAVLSGDSQPPNLHIESGNALNVEDISKVARYFKPEPVTVIHEGLLRYLNFSEKTTVARNVRSVLKRFGGVWITPDITLKSVLAVDNSQAPGQNQVIDSIVGRTIADNAFESVDAAQQFFESLGFTVEPHPLTEVIDDLSSPKKLGLNRKEVKRSLGEVTVFVMHIV